VSVSKLYFTTKTPAYTPATIRANLNRTSGLVTVALDSIKDFGGAIATVSDTETSSSSLFRVGLIRGVSGPLKAQTISGTVNLLLGASESNSGADFAFHLHLYATQGNSDTPRGTLLNDFDDNSSNEWPTTAAGKQLNAAQTLSALAIQAGDRLVAEIGFRAWNISASSFTGSLRYGTQLSDGRIAPDLVAGGTNVTAAAGFLQFSNPIDEVVPEIDLTQALLEAIRQGTATELDVYQMALEVVGRNLFAVPNIRIQQFVIEVVIPNVRRQNNYLFVT
jgi:hypothetical protein